ncbi:hypothetical protein, partial [Stenotrophomonas muris]|uniref:hypothetical protein n=1 Tax=Stenotrophomonas muris TaxID=2963283 RepID=UPI0039C5D163
PNVAQQRLGRSARSALRIPRQITEKGCPKAAFFSYLAERGGSDRLEPNLLILQQIANRTCVLCCVLPIIAVYWPALCKGDSR